MTVQDMHISFRMGLDKLDAAGNRDLRPEFIDQLLNIAQIVFIKRIIVPIKNKFYYGLEFDQRSIDSISTIVNEDIELVQDSVYDNYISYKLPDDYFAHIKTDVLVWSDKCDGGIRCIVKIRQHGDNFLISEFDKSDPFWRFVNGTFVGKNSSGSYGRYINIYYGDIDRVLMTYIRKPAFITIAGDLGGYTLPDGTVLTTNQDCELPEYSHQDIVNLAVLIAKGQIEMPTINYAMVEQNLMEN